MYVSFTEGIRDVSGPGALRAEDEGRQLVLVNGDGRLRPMATGGCSQCLVSCYQSYNNGSKPSSS